jgi:hypothetical protein
MASFFSFPVASSEPDEEQREPYRRQSPVHGPAADEIGRPVTAAFVLARTDTLGIAVRGIRVFSNGCVIEIGFTLRRSDENTEQWQQLTDIAFGGRFGHRATRDFLLFGVALSDGTATRTSDLYQRDKPDDAPHLTSTGGHSGSSGTERIHGSTELWLRPLPPTPTMDIVCAWPRLGLPETRHTIDTTVIREAAANAHWIWPEDADLPED